MMGLVDLLWSLRLIKNKKSDGFKTHRFFTEVPSPVTVSPIPMRTYPRNL
jgi:hypothetical protein